MDPSIAREAEQVTEHVRRIWRLLRRQLEADVAMSGLTAPQVQALDVLAAGDGLSVTELSERLGLTHGTVSGIVDRLEKRGLLARTPDPRDRRYTRLVLSEPVREYLKQRLPQRTQSPVAVALAHATPAERAQVVAGLQTLWRLLSAPGGSDEA